MLGGWDALQKIASRMRRPTGQHPKKTRQSAGFMRRLGLIERREEPQSRSKDSIYDFSLNACA